MLKKFKCMLTLLLTIALCVSSIPASVFAEALGDTQESLADTDSFLDGEEVAQGELEADESAVDAALEGEDETLPEGETLAEDETTEGAEGLRDAEDASVAPLVAVLLHHKGDETEFEQLAWVTYDMTEGENGVEVFARQEVADKSENVAEDEATEESQDGEAIAPLDYLALKLEGKSGNLEYRTRSMADEWHDEWTASGEKTLCEEGIGVVQARLTGELSETHELWYRAKTAEGAWLAWTHDGENAGSERAAIVDFQAILVQIGKATPTDEVTDTPLQAFEQQEMPAEAVQNEDEDNVEVVAQTDASATEEKSPTSQVEEEVTLDESDPSVEYRTYVQGNGWQGWQSNGATAGTTGKSLRVEALRMRLKDAKGGISYRAHVQGIGWQDAVSDGTLAGTTGKALRLEALKIKLTGAVAKTHNVWYRTHVQGMGWTAWKKNGTTAGTIGKGLRIEALEVQVLAKGEEAPAATDTKSTAKNASPTIKYKAHVQKIGWMDWVGNGKVAGTSGRSLRVEAMYIKLSGASGGIRYRTHVQTYGWQGWRSNGQMTGTSGQSKRLEAIQIKLTGAIAQTHDIYYRTHVQKIGWMGWAKNGGLAGSSGYAYRMEAVQIKLVRKGAAAPAEDGDTTSPYVGDVTASYRVNLQGSGWQATVKDGATAGRSKVRVQQLRAKVSGIRDMSLRYNVRLQNGKWQGWKSDNQVAGVSGQAITAVRFQLLGNFKNNYNVWYRVHVTNKGWMGWAKNSALAGTDWIAGTSSAAYAVDAMQIKVLRKTAKAPGSTINRFEYLRQLNGVDISGHNAPFDMSRLDADFVIIKATEGTDGTIWNPSYAQWADDALAQNKLVGFYHYANAKKKNASDAIAEADSFYEAIKAYKGRAIACLDWESVTYASGYVDNTVFGTTAEALWCKTFLDRLKSKFGGTPFLYTGKYASQNDYWAEVASEYPLWGAQYASDDPIYGYQANPWMSIWDWGPWGPKPTIFQYSGNGFLENGGKPEGYANQPLDLDLYYGTRSSWNTYLK